MLGYDRGEQRDLEVDVIVLRVVVLGPTAVLEIVHVNVDPPVIGVDNFFDRHVAVAEDLFEDVGHFIRFDVEVVVVDDGALDRWEEFTLFFEAAGDVHGAGIIGAHQGQWVIRLAKLARVDDPDG